MACSGCGTKKKKPTKLVSFVSTEEAKRRISICRPCENWVLGMCLACGCNMFMKTKLETLMNEQVKCEHKQGDKWQLT